MPLPTDQPPAQSGGLSRMQGWVTGLTGVLVLVPALVNGAYDIYASVAKLPGNETERISASLFKKYFNQAPLATLPVPIKRNDNTVQVELKVYDGGDIYVEFGKFGQWFPYPRAEPAPLALSLISAAYAQQAGSTQANGSYRQHDTLENGLVVRTRLWQNGVTEIKRIDPRTGEARETEIHPATAAERATMAQQAAPPTLHLTAPIDLDTLRRQQAPTVLSRDAHAAPGRQ